MSSSLLEALSPAQAPPSPGKLLQLLGTTDPRVFVIGVNESRVTLLSQQCRALNLAWALDYEKRLQPW
jgi:hypothetical protein